jgi:hypothetical protein
MGVGPDGGKALEIKGESVKKARVPALLNAFDPLPYHLRAGRYQCFGVETVSVSKSGYLAAR